jgi:hypothetical protein
LGKLFVSLKNDIEGGLGQCVAQMVAADLFNQAAGREGISVFGCVTTGEAWQFLRLNGTAALMDRQRYDIDNVGPILGIVRAIAVGRVLRSRYLRPWSRSRADAGSPTPEAVDP